MKRLGLLCLVLAAACGDDDATPDAPAVADAAPDSPSTIDSPVSDASTTDAVVPNVVGILFVNEVIPSNQDACADEFGDNDDLIELYNAGDAAIDLGGFTVTDDLTDPLKATLPAGLVIPAHGYLQLWCDEEVAQGLAHIAVKLSATAEDAAIFAPDGTLVDSFPWTAAAGDQAFARYPDGTGAFVRCDAPTCGVTNGAECTLLPLPDGGVPDAAIDAPEADADPTIDAAPTIDADPTIDAPLPPLLYINEVMASNTSSCADGTVQDSDWFEIYNAGPTAVDLNGYTVTDNPAMVNQFVLLAGTTIPAGGVLRFFADGTGIDQLHPNFKLSKTAEQVQLYAPGAVLVSEIAWTAADMANDNVALARLPDGTGAVTRCAIGTCGALNGSTCTPAARPTLEGLKK